MYRVMIVDDSATMRALIKRAIVLSGFEISGIAEAANGRQALEQIAASKPDLLLADLHMPEMGGAELIERLRADAATRNIPVAIITAEPSDRVLKALEGAGVRAHLSKPFTPESIRLVVTQLLESARAAA